jgi:ADP-ribose pyrophosphatase YjhB (NUDIX family)
MIVRRNDELLVLRRGHTPRRGYLDLPGGFIDAGESIEGAARRELREETGLVVGRTEELGMWWDRYDLPGFGPFPTMNFYFMARWKGGVPVAADDAAAAEWIPIGRLVRMRRRLAWRHMAGVLEEVRRRLRRR